MKEQILQIKKENPTWGYKKIARILNCAPNTVKYHLNPDERLKSKERTSRSRKTINGILKRKKDHFQMMGKRVWYGDKNSHRTRVPSSFSAKELKDKLKNNPKCYLTGKEIDLTQSKTYELDHITAISKGGTNSLENCGLACRNANRAKSDMSVNEFIELCKAVLIHNGYSVTQN